MGTLFSRSRVRIVLLDVLGRLTPATPRPPPTKWKDQGAHPPDAGLLWGENDVFVVLGWHLRGTQPAHVLPPPSAAHPTPPRHPSSGEKTTLSGVVLSLAGNSCSMFA